MRLLVIIVNYRTPDLTVGCLDSLRPEVEGADHPVRVVVVDGGSGDGSAERIEQEIANRGWSGWATLAPLAENRGFAAGNNHAMALGLKDPEPPDAFWLLNPDTVVRPGALAPLVRHLEENPRVGMVGSRLEDPDGTPQCSTFRFPTVLSEFERNLRLGALTRLVRKWLVTLPIPHITTRVGWLSGASLMVKRKLVEQVGPMDANYFLYFEEVDWCLRAHRAGWELHYVPTAQVVHLVGQASGFGDSRRRQPRRPTYWFDSRRYFYLKNYGPLRTILVDTAALLGQALWRLRRRIQRKPDLDPPGFLADLWRHSVFVRRFRIPRSS